MGLTLLLGLIALLVGMILASTEPNPAQLARATPLRELVSALVSWSGDAWISLGVLLLLATPLARLLGMAVEFWSSVETRQAALSTTAVTLLFLLAVALGFLA